MTTETTTGPGFTSTRSFTGNCQNHNAGINTSTNYDPNTGITTEIITGPGINSTRMYSGNPNGQHQNFNNFSSSNLNFPVGFPFHNMQSNRNIFLNQTSRRPINDLNSIFGVGNDIEGL